MPPPKKDSSSFFTILVAAVALGVVLAIGYHWGGESEAVAAFDRISHVRARERTVRKLALACEDEIASQQIASSEQGKEDRQEAKEIRDQIAQLKGVNDETYQSNEDIETKLAQCMGEMDALRNMWTVTDHSNAMEIDGLHEKYKGLLSASKRLQSTKGMRYVLLSQALRRTRREYFDLRGRLKLPPPAGDQDALLLKKWEAEVAKGGDLLPVMDSEMGRLNATVAGWKPFVYAPSEHTDIFVRKNESGTMTRPEWLGQKGNRAVTGGTLIGQPVERAYSLASRIRALLPIAMCALRNKAQNFTFPEQWKRINPPKGEQKGSLTLVNNSDLIDTPMVSFCKDCKLMSGTAEFRLACLGDTVDLATSVSSKRFGTDPLYGSYDFWRMRSRIGFMPRHYEAAKALMEDKELFDGRYAAVVFKNSKDHVRRCKAVANGELPLRHYLWIAGNYENRTINTISASGKERCKPELTTVLSAIKRMSTVKGINGVYVSASAGEEEEYSVIRKYYNDAVVFAPTTADEEAVDLIMISRAKQIIVNAYTDLSQIATEEYLMEHQFNATGVTFW